MIKTKTIFAWKDKESAVSEGAEQLRNGGLVVFPTETVYGLGANAFDAEAVKHIFEAKGRPQDNPLIVHIAAIEQIGDIAAEVSPVARTLMEAFWPGPLSVIMKKSARIPDEVSAGLETVAVRMPGNDLARELIARAGIPVAAPSANTSGKPSPTLARHAYEDLCGKVPLIIDGGPCRVGVESTVVDATGKVPVILRPGDITPGMIREAVGGVRVHDGVMSEMKKDEVCASPGMKYKHYAPQAGVTVFTGDKKEVAKCINFRYHIDSMQGKKAVVLCLDECAGLYAECSILPLGKNAGDAEAALFRVLREIDEQGFDAAYFHAQEEKMGLAVMNRMIRAAGHHIVAAGEEKE
ncbi:L-threonylcarbamoyladenylate synthase [Christensenella tenuis]|uniref:Threonylcarbamoyl-AMP synthase n=1 Tax=Christensenella tenuis TaxID=2763033 RepID=A0ABR7ED02_9FIRM|nr:L-threonylcarbamoyladenylate synthase [Christensenella tenuis]MBC5647655.1 threonylcarbamoyl-AMP synthase [Christensenella tenuis]